MVSTLKKKQSIRRLVGQFDDFDQNFVSDNTACDRQENATVNERTGYQEFTVDIPGSCLTVKKNAVNMKTLERCFNERNDRELCNIIDTVQNRIQNANFTAIDRIITPKIELAVRSITASSVGDATSDMANSEREEHIEISAPFENVSERNNTLYVLTDNTNDETQNNIPDKVNCRSQDHILTGNYTLITPT